MTKPSHCKCGHDIELHSLETLALVDSPDPDCDNRLAWRFECRGGLPNTLFAPVQCPCNNFTLMEEKKK